MACISQPKYSIGCYSCKNTTIFSFSLLYFEHSDSIFRYLPIFNEVVPIPIMISFVSDGDFVGLDLSLESVVMIIELVCKRHDDGSKCWFIWEFNLIVYIWLFGLFLL